MPPELLVPPEPTFPPEPLLPPEPVVPPELLVPPDPVDPPELEEPPEPPGVLLEEPHPPKINARPNPAVADLMSLLEFMFSRFLGRGPAWWPRPPLSLTASGEGGGEAVSIRLVRAHP